MPDLPVIHVIDDDAAVRSSLLLLLETAGFAVEGYISAGDFLEKLPSIAAGCIVSDVRMPGMDGLQLQRALSDMGVDMPFIVITGHGDVPMAVDALRNGAADFIEKPFPEEVLIAAVRSALDSGELQYAAGAAASEIEGRINGLTPQEREILEKLVDGDPNKTIAHDLQLHTRIVEEHRANIMQKMKARSLSELIRLVLMVTRSRQDSSIG